jgi:hypothetical protein
MSEPSPTPSTTEKTVVVSSCHLRSLWTLTLLSLALNLLILALIVIGVIVHHFRAREMAEQNALHSALVYAQDQRGPGNHFGGMRQGGRGDDNRGNFGGGGGRFGGNRGGDDNGGPGGGGGRRFADNGPGGNNGGPGGGGMGRMGGGGFGGGMMGGGRNGQADPAQMSDRMLNRLTRQLSLTDDEQAKLKPVIEAQATQMQKDMQAQQDTRQKAMADTKAKIRALLTPDQQKQFDAMPMPGGPRIPGVPTPGQ